VYGAAATVPMVLSDTWRSLARALLGEPEFTSLEVARETGVDPEVARRLWRALGFPPVPDDERVFTRSDVAMLRAARALVEQGAAEPHVLMQLTRVTGQSLARVAEAQVATTADRLARTGEESELASVEAIANALPSFLTDLEPFLSYVWRRHLLAAVFRFAAATGSPSPTRPMAVGFVDLVGFTAVSQQLDAEALAALVERFEALAYEHIPERGGRVIKTIGDSVMFAADEATVAAEIALALVEAYARDAALPDVRVGLAYGETLSWEGDLFGRTVNLANRLVNLARPGTVLASEELGQQLKTNGGFVLRHRRRIGLKGIGRVRVWVVRRAPAPA